MFLGGARRAVRAGLVVFLVGAAGAARAEPTAEERGIAGLLFQQGRALLQEGKITEACQKLEESQRLDPGGGTLLNLALCHEREGRLASSWSEFREAARIARRDGRADREAEAASHMSALEPRLSRLTIVVPPATQVNGLRIERNGHEVGRGAWSTPIPVDGGEHVVRATALGREPFTGKVTVGNESDARTIEIPALAIAVVVTPPAAVPPDQPPSRPWVTPKRMRWTGVGAAGVGVLSLAAAGWALASALDLKQQSDPHCTGNYCDEPWLEQRNEAESRGNLATILGVSGAVLVGAGVALYYFGRRADAAERKTAATTTTARFVFGAAPGTAMTGIEGSF
jgi:hypothetical protein